MMLTIIMRRGNFAKLARARRPQNRLCAGMLALLVLTGCGPPGVRALHRGDRLVQEGQYADAIEPLQEAAADLTKTSPLAASRADNLLGVAQQATGHPGPAWQAYQQALKLDRNLAVVDYNLGCLEIQQSNYPAAIASLTSYTTLRPHESDGYSRLGDAHLHLSFLLNPRDRAREYEAALVAYETAEKILPSAETANAPGMASLQRRTGPPTPDEIRAAVHAFQTALDRSSNYPPAV